jgi:membrane-bound lytic murein transglycosylase D
LSIESKINLMNHPTLNRIFFVFTGIGISFTLLFFLNFEFDRQRVLEEDSDNFPQKYQIITPDFPDELTIFGEKVPIQSIEIHERIEREFIVNTYWHSATLLLIKKANRWFPVIEPILKKNGIPDDFKYISMIESNLTNVISPAGATGFWQFMKPAAIKYGLEVNSEVDERYNLEKSTEAACRYLKDSYDKFGTWTLAAASYNMGLTGVERQMERQKAETYYDLVLNDETSRYIARAVSMKIISSNYEKYGFNIADNELYPEIETYDIEINGEVKHFADFAKENGINYMALKYFNPWLRDNYLTNKSKKKYIVKIPVDKDNF